jgi:hypothetical protein
LSKPASQPDRQGKEPRDTWEAFNVVLLLLLLIPTKRNENVTSRENKQNKIGGKRESIPIRRIRSEILRRRIFGKRNWKMESKDEAHAELRSDG